MLETSPRSMHMIRIKIIFKLHCLICLQSYSSSVPADKAPVHIESQRDCGHFELAFLI
ncbi:hypothetical protein [Virgibacillus oceani]|uniref:hypothetical protein n=1 Tax=Virgibacillus oceani TaxID=1479511 RepID=UPI001E4C43C7|nr:hypothetical protein [Virgibacillus oceani]